MSFRIASNVKIQTFCLLEFLPWMKVFLL